MVLKFLEQSWNLEKENWWSPCLWYKLQMRTLFLLAPRLPEGSYKFTKFLKIGSLTETDFLGNVLFKTSVQN